MCSSDEIAHPVPPHRALDVVAEVGHPVGGPHQRRTLPCHRVGQPHTVGRPAERDVLARRRRLLGRFRRGGDGRRVGGDGADELVSAAAHRPDVALRLAVVAERAAGRLDPAGQRRLADESPAPHRVEQLLLGDEPVVVADQLGQDVEHLRFDADRPRRRDAVRSAAVSRTKSSNRHTPARCRRDSVDMVTAVHIGASLAS